jgi:integrase
MKRPAWLKPLTDRDERLRAAHGLTPKRDGWYKSLDGRTRYVAKPMGVPEVVALIPARVNDIRAKSSGRTVTVAQAGLTLEALAELYLAWLYQRLTTGVPKKLNRRTYDDNVRTIDRFVELVGPDRIAETIGPDDFTRYAKGELAGRAPSSVRRFIIYVEAFANWAAPGSRKAGHLSRPWQFGPDFRKPSDDEITTSAADSDKAYSPAQVRRAFLRVKRSPLLRAAGWLALNCAFGPKDIGTLPESVVDLDAGAITFPRGKTGVGRQCVLWRPTVLALRAYLANRPPACRGSAAGLFFRSSNGLPHYREPEGEDAGAKYDGIGNRWCKLTGLPLGGLRATFATIADEWEDQRAVDVVMGHRSKGTIRQRHYAKRMDRERIRRLVEHIRPRAFGRV